MSELDAVRLNDKMEICAHTIILFEAKLTATSQINLVLTKQEPCMVVSLISYRLEECFST